jgi:hypothetical protein
MAIKNAPTFKIQVSVLETRVVPQPAQDQTSGKAACPFEARVTQESGTH